MSEEMLILHCSPTLAGIKTGSLFSYPYENSGEIKESVRALNRRLAGKGLRIIPLHDIGGKALIYVYRPGKLSEYFKKEPVRRLLSDLGYDALNPEECIIKLIKKLDENAEFPHEIGLFLGYPPEDVKGFIENGAANYKHLGLWKVYGDVPSAEKIFEKYRKCTRVYFNKWAEGSSLEKLTVTV